MKLIIHELRAAIDAPARGRPRHDAEGARARQADAAPAVRAVGRAGDADAVRVHGVPPRARRTRRASSRCSTASSSSCSATRTPTMLEVFAASPPSRRRLRRACSSRRPVRRVPALSRAPRPRGAGRLRSSATGRSRTAGAPICCRCSRRSTRTPKADWDRVRAVRGARRRRGELPALALPPHEDRRADHRLQARHRRLVEEAGKNSGQVHTEAFSSIG